MLTVANLLDMMRPFPWLVNAVLHAEVSQLSATLLQPNNIRIMHMAHFLPHAFEAKTLS